MKRYIVLVIFALLFACVAEAAEKGAKPSIVTTIFPEYDWVREILGGEASRADVSMLVDSGVDIHSFQPSVDDILKVSTCDLFICVGGESDEWVEGALAEAMNKDMRVIKLLDVLGDRAKEEERVEGMEAEKEHEGEEEEDEPELDEHVWLSLKNARVFVSAIADVICELDPEHADAYRANAAAYSDKLSALDAEYQAAVSAATFDTLLFGDRFPFRYMVDDYGLKYFAAFAGCSAETEASFQTITFLSRKADELSLRTILAIEGSDRRIAETIAQNTAAKDQKIVVLDSMQSVTARDAKNGLTYLSVAKNNLEALKEALK